MERETPDRDDERSLAEQIEPEDAKPADEPGYTGEPGREPDEDHVVEEKARGE